MLRGVFVLNLILIFGSGCPSSPPGEDNPEPPKEKDETPHTGEEGGPCFPDESCQAGLECVVLAGTPTCIPANDAGSDGSGDGSGITDSGSSDGSGDGGGITDSGSSDGSGDGSGTTDAGSSDGSGDGSSGADSGCHLDSDGDQVLDCADGCPVDPNKSEPGICGCGVAETDTDSDLTPDCIDECPNDSDKTTPGGCGCGVVDLDTDNDGTPNCIDLCPDDTDKIAPGDCGCGVSEEDTDNDGTANCIDLCPNDPDKVSPGTCGCGTADADWDNDGLLNCLEACPYDSEKTEPGFCGCGNVDDSVFTELRDEVLFITAATFSGKLQDELGDRLVDADAACQTEAEAAGLGTNFLAIVSDGALTLDERVSLCGRATNPAGTVLFESVGQMVASGGGLPSSEALTDAAGDSVSDPEAWTGLTVEGLPSASNCEGFTLPWGSRQGSTGDFTSNLPGGWLDSDQPACNTRAPLYCISQLPATLTELSISPEEARVVPPATSTTLVAFGEYTYGPKRDVSTNALWESSDTNIATVLNGVVTFSTPGEVTITATYEAQVATAMVEGLDAAEIHKIFMTAEDATLGSNDNVQWQNNTNAFCQDKAQAAGLEGNWLGVYCTGFVRDINGFIPHILRGPVVNFDGEVVFWTKDDMQDDRFEAPITTDENGDALSAGANAWTCECHYDFLADANIASYGTSESLNFDQVTCTGRRRRICISE